MNISLTAINLLLTAAAFFLVLLASFRLLRSRNIPGSRLIFAALVGSLLVAFAPIPESLSDDQAVALELASAILNAMLLLAGAYGFWRLANHAVMKGAPGGDLR